LEDCLGYKLISLIQQLISLLHNGKFVFCCCFRLFFVFFLNLSYFFIFLFSFCTQWKVTVLLRPQETIQNILLVLHWSAAIFRVKQWFNNRLVSRNCSAGHWLLDDIVNMKIFNTSCTQDQSVCLNFGVFTHYQA
jgi:hypothetical protein